MKKIISLVLVAFLCTGMISCSKSEEAQNVDNLILTMGEVTLDNEEEILHIEELYNALSKRQQKKIENIATLEAKRAEYNALVVDEVEAAISAIGAVERTEKSEAAIVAARSTYDEIHNDLKKDVENYSVLTDAEKKLVSLKVEYVEGVISAIGEVTVDSQSKIDAAEKAMELYDDEIRKLVSNAADIEKAKNTIFTKKIEYVENAINAIGEVTLDSESLIKAAKSAYDKYDDSVKENVSNADILTKAEESLVVAMKTAVEAEIANIGTVTADSSALITSARNIYDKYSKIVTDAGKTIDNYTILTDAEAAYETLLIEKGKVAFSKLKADSDEVRGYTFYEPSTKPYYANTRSYILPYIGTSSTSVWLRFRRHYTGDDWLFFKNITYAIDDEREYDYFNYFDVERDNGSGDVWEWADTNATEDDIELLRKIAASKKTIVRFSGDNYHYDYTIPEKDKIAITQVLDAYEYLLKTHGKK